MPCPYRTNCAYLGELVCRVKTEAKLFAAQLRIECRGEVQALLAAVDSIGREAAQREGACRDLQQRIEGLQDDRIEMLAQMAAMAPRSELDNAKEEVSWLRGELAGLRGEAAAAQEERERLISMLQVIAL